MIPPHFTGDFSHPLLGYLGAGVSTAVYWVAQTVDAIPPPARGWMEVGGTFGLIGGLTYGCVTLWKELQRVRSDANAQLDASRKEISELNREIRGDWKTQNDKLITVLEKLDKDS